MSDQPSLQLLLEQALAAYVAQQAILPATYRIYPAHGAEILDPNLQSYLRIVASRAGADEALGAGNFALKVEFQLFSGGVEDEAKIPAVTAEHDAIAQLLSDLWATGNFFDARAALNAPLVEGIGFTGWDTAEPEDGRTETQLVARLKYVFECYLADPVAAPPDLELSRPYGLFDLFASNVTPVQSQPGWTNGAVVGMAYRFTWDSLEGNADNTYDWSRIDAAVALGDTNGKQVMIYFGALLDYPSWLVSETVNVVQHGDIVPMLVPWVEPAHSKFKEFIAAIGARYNGVTQPRITAIVMGGMGQTSSLMTKDPLVQAQLDEILDPNGNGGLSAWKISCRDFVTAHAAAFPSTPFIFNGKNPYGNVSEGDVALSDLIVELADLYPGRLGIMTPDLASNTPLIGVNGLINLYHETNPVGFQLRSTAAGFDDVDLGCPNGTEVGDCLILAIDKGGEIGAHWVHVYAADVNNADFHDRLVTAGAQFEQWA